MIRRLIPGVALVAGLGVLAWVLQLGEERLIGAGVIEAIVIAILLGVLWRTVAGTRASLQPGIAFSGKQVLEVAIVLLGASINLPTLVAAGPALIGAIVAVVLIGIVASTLLGRALGLNRKLATLVAVGNSICGNSAIAAVAPVIGATADDIAGAISLTAVVGVGLVLTLPLLIPVLGYTFHQYGVLAGMTVYAVPQVLAATMTVSPVSTQVATLVKLTRVLLLGPVVLFYSLRQPAPADGGTRRAPLSPLKLVPWFLIGFLVLALARSVGLLPVAVADPMFQLSRWLTIGAMAALGLGVDVRVVAKVGQPVAVAVIGSLAVMITVSIVAIRVLGV